MRFWIIYIFVQILLFWGLLLPVCFLYFLSLANHSGEHVYSAPHQKKASYGPVLAGEVERKEKLKNLLICGKFSFHVVVDRELFTYVKNKK